MSAMSGTPPVRQEHLPASPDVTEVAPGVLRLQLPIQLPGLAHINTYAIIGPTGVTIVDPGLPGADSWRDLVDRLGKADVSMQAIESIYITHAHPDHFGNAGKLADESGADLVTHRAFRTMFDPSHDCTNDDCDDPLHAHSETGQQSLPYREARTTVEQVAPWGPTSLEQPGRPDTPSQTLKLVERGWVLPKPTKRVRNGDALPIGNGSWIAIHTPGHTLDHVCLFDQETGTFISGDHVLPTITPHISGMYGGDDPLGYFFTSLDMVAQLPGIGRCLPAHGDVFDDLPTRVKDIKEHHAERLDRLRKVSIDAGGWADVAEYSHHLFRKERWGIMAESETYAHLEHMRLNGEAERRLSEVDGRHEFRAVTA